MDLKYLLWIWLAIPVMVGTYQTIKGIIEIYKDLKGDDAQ